MMDKIIREHARLIILEALEAQANGSLNADLLREELKSYGISQPLAWVHEEMRYLASLGALRIVEMGSTRIASITAKGMEHCERATIIEGVRRPALEV